MKTLYIDIETSPLSAEVWGLWNQNIGISQISARPRILCFAAKWGGTSKTIFKSEWLQGRDKMLSSVHTLLDKADAVVHYNGERFDVPWLNTEMALEGMTPPSPFMHVDLLRTVKKQFRFPSNKLEYVSSAFGLGHKLKHDGFDLWNRVMAGDKEARALMRAYNEQDVLLLEPLHHKLGPWLIGGPNQALYNDDFDSIACPLCGEHALRREGFSYTRVGKYQQYQCRTCGKWSRGRKNLGLSKVSGL